ncbi:type II/IV secretion system ATPase subunit [uncultured Methanoregula sp.]|uniref:type II/IV secretion system ATPase subunit n=1 Tax=uncultured Methanoregula sp. TaxID=1005933 RepID=UPI0037484034
MTPESGNFAAPGSDQPGKPASAIISRVCDLPRATGSGTPWADMSILIAGTAAVLSGYMSLFVILPIPVLAALGIVSLTLLALTVSSIRYRVKPGPFQKSVPNSRAPVIASEFMAGEPAVPASLEWPTGTLDAYWIEEPFVSIRIIRRGNQGFIYHVIEPPLSSREEIVLRETYNRLRKVILYDDPENPPLHRFTRDAVSLIIREFSPDITDDRLDVLAYYVRRDLSGFGRLEPLMQDAALEDISCNGDNLPVFVFHRTYGSLPTSVLFREGELNAFVLKLAQKAGKQISLTNPMIDATLPGGSRVQVTYSNVVSLRGSSFTIRKFRADPMTPIDLLRFGTYSAEILAFLWLSIAHRKSLIIAGGTASGKTSTMNAVSLFIPQNAKIVSLEDTHEIQLPHKNWLATLTRELNIPGIQGDIDLFSLLKSSMRQRPEYIIVGEVRGREAQTLFQAMNTGHATLSTIHAGSVYEAINRLTHEPINVPPVMFTALDLVISQSISTFGNNRTRRCHAIHEINVGGDGTITPRKLFEWDTGTDSFRRTGEQSRVLAEICAMMGWTGDMIDAELKKREEFLKIAIDVPAPDIHDLASAIHEFSD